MRLNLINPSPFAIFWTDFAEYFSFHYIYVINWLCFGDLDLFSGFVLLSSYLMSTQKSELSQIERETNPRNHIADANSES